MNNDEIIEMMEWMSTADIQKFPLDEQLVIANAFGEFVGKLKPIYVKHQLAEGNSTFIFKM